MGGSRLSCSIGEKPSRPIPHRELGSRDMERALCHICYHAAGQSVSAADGLCQDSAIPAWQLRCHRMLALLAAWTRSFLESQTQPEQTKDEAHSARRPTR